MSARMEARLKGFTAPNVFNPWGQSDPLDQSIHTMQHRWELLQHHFARRPRYLLIGEAPGYRGCHFSGVPFTSEAQIAAGTWQRYGYPFRLTTRPKPWGEASATVVWRTLHKLGIAEQTVCWNAFPFHPFKPGDPYSNRAPTLAELNSTRDILAMVLDHFRDAVPIAVGQIALASVCRLNHEHRSSMRCVRHPSMGGAAQFAQQLEALLV